MPCNRFFLSLLWRIHPRCLLRVWYLPRMATVLPGIVPTAGEDRKFHRAAHGLSLPLRSRRPEFKHPIFVARSGAAGAIPALISPLETTSSISLISTAKLYMTLFGAGLLAYVLSRPEEKESGKECPRCNGTGREVCWCRGWSDGDSSGCQSCNYSGFTSCKACGGGGTAVPIPLKIRADDAKRQQ